MQRKERWQKNYITLIIVSNYRLDVKSFMSKFLDEFGLARMWQNIKTYITNNSGVGVTMDQVNTAIQEALKDYVKKPDESAFSWWSPHMTSNTAPAPYVASASSYLSHTPPSLAFDGDHTTPQNLWHSQNVRSWIQFDFGQQVLVKGIRMYPEESNENTWRVAIPKVFTILGSNDGLNYVTLFESTDGGGYTPTIYVARECIFSDNYKNYRIYKIDCDINYNETYYACISEIEFYLDPNSLSN